MTNVIRHSRATRVKITLKKEPLTIELSIKDNGKGIDANQISDPKSFGIFSMKERAIYWGGRVEISSASGKGTQVLVSIPLEDLGERK